MPPTPLDWSSISSTCAVEPKHLQNLPNDAVDRNDRHVGLDAVVFAFIDINDAGLLCCRPIR